MAITLNIWKLKDRLPQMNETMIFDLNPLVFQQGLYLKWGFIDESVQTIQKLRDFFDQPTFHHVSNHLIGY